MLDTSLPLVEPCCGSCGCRWDGQVLAKESAILYTHHQTAPAVKVSVHCAE